MKRRIRSHKADQSDAVRKQTASALGNLSKGLMDVSRLNKAIEQTERAQPISREAKEALAYLNKAYNLLRRIDGFAHRELRRRL